MKKQLSALSRVRISSLLRVMILSILVLTTSVGLYSLRIVQESYDVSKDLYKLKSDILVANLAIRDAAIAHTARDIDLELQKTLVTRSDATRIYERLEGSSLSPEERRTFEEMKIGRPIYREAQNRVVSYIKIDDDTGFWKNLPAYQVHLDQYVRQTDTIITSVNTRVEAEYERLRALILSALVFGIIWVTYALWRVYR